MSCCAPSGYTVDEVDGICPYCGENTVCEEAFEQCSYSPVECKVCGWAPCDQSC